MTAFDKRKESEEKKFAHESELGFKATARRNRLLGEWAAEKMGVKSEEIGGYAKSVVEADFEEPGSEDVFRKVKKDLEQAGIQVDERDLREKMQELALVAKKQVESE